MRSAIALGTAAVASLLLFQVVSISTAPPIVVEHSATDGSPTRDSTRDHETFELAIPLTDPAAIVLPNSGVSVAAPPSQDLPSATVAPTSTTSAAATTTTTRAVPPTTVAAAVPTTTVPVATTTTTAAAVASTTPPGTAPLPTTTTGVISAAAAVSGSYSVGAESDFLARINGLRASVGLAGLAANGELNNYARWWAKQMADSGVFSHSDIGSLLDPWKTIGENLGYGPAVAAIFDKLVASPLHYANMVDPRFTSVGAGAYVDSTGRIWTAHVFGG